MSVQITEGRDGKTLSHYYNIGQILLKRGCSFHAKSLLIKKKKKWKSETKSWSMQNGITSNWFHSKL